jgi:trimethylamine--corrinoid protein Co-methyltransferase
LSPAEVQAIQSASHRLLATVGVKVPHPDILNRLADAAAEINRATQTARFKERLILDSVARAEKSYTLYGRDRQKQARFGQGCGNFLSSAGQYAWVDPVAKTRRESTVADTVQAIRVGDALLEIDIVGAMAIPADVPVPVCDVVANALLVQHTTKPIAGWAFSGTTARYVLDILAVAAGGRDELARYPLCEGFVEPISPLQFRSEGLDILIEFANAGLPVGFGPMVMAMATGPATLAGTLAQENAEILAGIVIAQVLKPGLPVTYWGIPHIMDPATSLISFGSAEQGIMAVAMTQIGKAYGLPVGINVGLTDAKIPDAQAGLEKGMTLLMGALAGADIFGHVGIAGADQGASLPQLVIDNEMAAYVRRIAKGFVVNPETLAIETIEAVGIGGNFLAEPHTRDHFRREVMFPQLLDRRDWATWLASGGHDTLARAAASIDDLSSRHQVEPLEEHQRQEIEAIVADATARLAHAGEG